VRWEEYGAQLEENLRGLHARLRQGAYRARPSRRVYIPKADGRQRPLGIAALEDKIVQRATVEVLNAIYEADFLGFSYGFRPGRSQHDALDALVTGIRRKKVNWVLDADIRGFFDAIDHGWLLRFVEHRIADRRLLRLMRKWLAAGVMEDGKWAQSREGTPQGATISPLLANLYLHYVLDLWVQQWRRRPGCGEVIITRYADDFIVGFEHRADAERFLSELRERLRKFSLELHPEKTRLIEFGRFAARQRRAQSLGKPDTFNFLGFTHICAKTKAGKFLLTRRTMQKRMREKLHAIKNRAAATPASADPNARAVARQRGTRLLGLPCRADQHSRYACLSRAGDAALVSLPPPPKPTHATDLGADDQPGRALAAPSPHSSSMARTTLRRQNPRQEPSALVALAGICAGGGP
jgi:group II intron reverse transcriptase/maturase